MKLFAFARKSQHLLGNLFKLKLFDTLTYHFNYNSLKLLLEILFRALMQLMHLLFGAIQLNQCEIPQIFIIRSHNSRMDFMSGLQSDCPSSNC